MSDEAKKIPELLRDEFAPELTVADIAAHADNLDLDGPRVTKEIIESKIASIVYTNVPPDNQTTVCAVTMKNGTTVTASSQPIDPRAFDRDIGRKIAYDKVFRELWVLEGYLLRECVWAQEQIRSRVDQTDTQAAMGHPAHG